MSHTEIKLPDRCLTALRYYVGEASARPELPQDPKAYNTLNALYFDGISTERARASEGRPLNGELLLFPEALISLGRDLLQALEPGKADAADGPLYRVEREADAQAMRSLSRTVSFTSTSRAGFLDAYTDKRGLVLMEFFLPAGTPRADMARLMSRYIKPQEAEVLLPPGLPLRFRERPLTAAEKGIRDRDGDPPVCALAAEPGIPAADAAGTPLPVTAGDAAAGVRVCGALAEGLEPAPEDLRKYLRFKRAFRSRLNL